MSSLLRLRIHCPHCGIRAVEEFLYGEIPATPGTVTEPDARDVDRAFMHTNMEGLVTERWFHSAGCRRWFTVQRDTRTNEIKESVGPYVVRPGFQGRGPR